MSLNILLAGESWMKHTIHVKGFDSFTTSEYEEGVQWLREAFERAGHHFTFMPGHLVPEQFPRTVEQLQAYDVVILSDIGANSLLLSNETFLRSTASPNRLQSLHDYVQQGGGLLMIGGYLTFQGIEGKGRYQGTPVEQCLPVEMLAYDDRVESPEGVLPQIRLANHPILEGLPENWPAFLGYNRFRSKPGAEVLLQVKEDPFLVTHGYGEGRSAAFASDCSPHWAPPAFLNWDGYHVFWNKLVNWLAHRG